MGFFLLSVNTAHAYDPVEGNVYAILGPIVTQTKYQSDRSDFRSPYFGDFALIAQGDINKRGALEIVMAHMNKVFYIDQGPNFLAEQSEFIHISMGYRQWLASYFSLGLAFYSAYSMGSPKIVSNDQQPGSGLITSARDKTEYGFDLSVQQEVWSQDRYALLLDGRYSYSVTAKPDESANHYMFLLGLRYFIQEKTVMKKPDTAL